jgi:hypothetical protein
MIYLKYKKLFNLFLLFLVILPAGAQVDQTAFFQRLKTMYYSLNDTDIKNFSALVKSSLFEKEFDNYFAEEDLFPLEIIWVKPDKYYYIKKPLPSLIDTTKTDIIDQKIMEMRQELGSIFLNWQRFVAGQLYEIIPENYEIEELDDKIIITYKTDKFLEVRLVLGKNGLCLKIINTDFSKEQTIYTYPAYTYLNNLWLCTGWTVQIEEKGEIVSGFVISLKSRKVRDYFLPDRIILNVQTMDKKNLIFERIYDFRSVMVNRELQITN